MQYSLGLDLGGTNLKAACVSNAGSTLLFKSVEIGQEIPMDLYRAVAEVLAYVYRVLGRHSHR